MRTFIYTQDYAAFLSYVKKENVDANEVFMVEHKEEIERLSTYHSYQRVPFKVVIL